MGAILARFGMRISCVDDWSRTKAGFPEPTPCPEKSTSRLDVCLSRVFMLGPWKLQSPLYSARAWVLTMRTCADKLGTKSGETMRTHETRVEATKLLEDLWPTTYSGIGELMFARRIFVVSPSDTDAKRLPKRPRPRAAWHGQSAQAARGRGARC